MEWIQSNNDVAAGIIAFIVAVILLWMLNGSEYGSGAGWSRGSHGLSWSIPVKAIIGYVLCGALVVAGLILNLRWTLFGGLAIAAVLTPFECVRVRKYDYKDGKHGSGRFDRYFGPFHTYSCDTAPLWLLGPIMYLFSYFVCGSFIGTFFLSRLIMQNFFNTGG